MRRISGLDWRKHMLILGLSKEIGSFTPLFIVYFMQQHCLALPPPPPIRIDAKQRIKRGKGLLSMAESCYWQLLTWIARRKHHSRPSHWFTTLSPPCVCARVGPLFFPPPIVNGPLRSCPPYYTEIHYGARVTVSRECVCVSRGDDEND